MENRNDSPTVGALYNNSRLIAKSLDGIIIGAEQVDLSSWRNEAKLLCTKGGSCCSSSTLLVKDEKVPTYSLDGRSYGLLLNAEKCYIYDVNKRDANTNRTDKLRKRGENHHINFLTSNTENLLTLDELSAFIKKDKPNEMNEVLLDAWKDSCVGLYVKDVNLSGDKWALKKYYFSLIAALLIKKYLEQAFDFPPLKICRYNESQGRLLNPVNNDELFKKASMHDINKQTYPQLFAMLSEDYKFEKVKMQNVKEYLHNEIDSNLSKHNIQIIASKLAEMYEPFDGEKRSGESILNEQVDMAIGVDPILIRQIYNTVKNKLLVNQSLFSDTKRAAKQTKSDAGLVVPNQSNKSFK